MNTMRQLEGKDLNILKDQLGCEELAYKKCLLYSQQIGDQQLKGFVNQLASQHKQNYNTMQQYLSTHC